MLIRTRLQRPSNLTAVFVCVAMSAVWSAGCAGRASLHMVPFRTSGLTPGRKPLINIDDCSAAWCQTESGGPRIVLSRSWPFGWGELLAVIDLPEMPAGRGKEYPLSKGRVQAVWHGRWGFLYFRSFAGAIAIERQGNVVLRMAMRSWVRRWRRGLMGGWDGPVSMMLCMSGSARWDDAQVERIATKLEKLTGKRPDRTAKRQTPPATRPAQDQP